MVNREELLQWAKEQYGTEPDFPWGDESAAVLRHRDSGKWYALLMAVKRSRLGLTGEGEVDVVNVKCDPLLIGALRAQRGFHPAYHMNRDRWITIRLDGSVAAEEVQNLVALSHTLTGPRQTRRKV